MPFNAFSSGDISRVRRDLMESLASSLDRSGAEIAGMEQIRELVLDKGKKDFSEEDAYALSAQIPADFAVAGSIVLLGDVFEANWRLIDLKSKEPVAFYSKSSVTPEELYTLAGEAGKDMYSKMGEALQERPVSKSGAIDAVLISGNQRVDTQAIHKKLSSKAGEQYSPDDIREDIRGIYAMGFFDDVRADLSDTADGKVLTFIVKEKPFISRIEIAGEDEVKEETLMGAVTLKERTVVDRGLIQENAEKIKKVYEEEGYYLAEVKPEIRSDGLEAAVIFRINEGPEVKVRRITIIGNSFFSDRKLKKSIATREAGLFSAITKSGTFNEFVFQNDLDILLARYYDSGFIQAEILDSRVLLSEDRKWFYITIALNEGERFKIKDIDIKGDILTTREELLKKFGLKKDAYFSREKLVKGIDAVKTVYGDEGYAFAEIRPLTDVKAGDRTVDITFDIKKNELTYIGDIEISGNVKTKDKVIRREVELDEGDQYSASALKRSRGNLKRLGFFEDVLINQTPGAAPDRMNLDVLVKERPTGQISFGMGYSSVDKIVGTASLSQSNLMGTGIKLDLSGTLSATSSRYVLGVTEPWLFDKPISAGFDIYDTGRQYPDFEMNKTGFDIRLGFPVGDRYTRGYLTYKLEAVDIFDVDPDASIFIREQEGSSTESSIRAVLKRDTRNDAFFPTEGKTITLSAEFAGGPLGGTSSFVKYEAEAVQFFPMPWDTSFSLKGTIGYVQGFEGKKVPIYEKYFLGGISSLRGFETRTVGPKDAATGDIIGGEAMALLNAEYLFPIFGEPSLRGVVFFDAGNAYESGMDFSDLRTSAGLGIRWFSPIGPLRLELGFNLDPREDEKAQVWEFAIGTGF